MSNLNQETVTGVRHWTDKLFSFTATRDPSFRFQSGQFTMIGLQVDGKPLLRAYSMASAHYEEQLEFFSIKAPNGPLTSRLQHLQPGDPILVGRKPVGTLVQDSLMPGHHPLSARHRHRPRAVRQHHQGPRRLRPLRDHRARARLPARRGAWPSASSSSRACRRTSSSATSSRDKLRYYPTVTREEFQHQGRITELLETHKLTDDLGLPPLGPAERPGHALRQPGLPLRHGCRFSSSAASPRAATARPASTSSRRPSSRS